MPFAKVPPLPPGALVCLFKGRVKRRIAQGDVEDVIGLYDPFEDIFRIVLAPEPYVQTVSLADLARRFD